MALDGAGLARALGAEGQTGVCTQLCRAQLDQFKTAAAAGGPLVVGCTQESPLFEETRAEFAPDTEVRYVNIRERAGWSEAGPAALPKMAALLAEATVEIPATPTITLESKGDCLVYGRDQSALDAAKQLAARLTVTLLLTPDARVIPPHHMDVPVYRGRIRQLRGHLGAFEVEIDGHAPYGVSSREQIGFEHPRDGVRAACDLVLDLSGGAPLVPGPAKRDGYFRPDPANPAAVQRALFDLTDLTGTFEKPRYVDFKADICAHGRSGRTGCTRCLEVCPAGAIASAGDTVKIDPYICGGCGLCHSVCPTGAAGYNYPPAHALLERLRTLFTTYGEAGARDPSLLVHDEDHGLELISMMGRFGRGLPAGMIPFGVNEVTQLGFDVLVGALAYGAERILILVPPKRRDELAGLQAQLGYLEAVLDGLGYHGDRLRLIEESDPDAVEARLHERQEGPAMPEARYLPSGGKRTLMRLGLQALHEAAPAPVDHLPLPEGAPFGRLQVDVEGCTLCLACVSACPTGALQDNPERPQLAFQEDACVQCGLCASTCPERVITLEPRLNFTDEARRAIVVKDEEPATCVRCGKPFGTRSSIERIVARLGEKHWMFNDAAATERIRMCQDCRVVAQFETSDNPFAAGPRPRPRTTEDELRERAEALARQENGRDQN